MLKSYKAIYNHGAVEWVGEPPPFDYAPILVVVEEPTSLSEESNTQPLNGGVLVKTIDQWPPESRCALVEKFGDPVSWQHEQRQERKQPGRDEK